MIGLTLRNVIRRGLITAATALLFGGLATTQADDIASYYVGVDAMPNFTSGVYNGLPNPNYNRLTFLYAHVYPDNPANNHYHSKGRYQLIGTPPNVSTNVNPSNFLPEGALPPLLLTVGSGIYAGKYVAAPYTDTNDQNFAFSKLEIRNTEELAAAITNSSASILFNSSAGRWTGALTGADVHLVLEYLTPGLNVGSLDATNIGLNNPEDDYHIGDGLFSFTPVLWTEAHAAPGTYVAQFRLSDESGTFLDSGTFEFRVQVPEPVEPVSYYVGVDVMPNFTSGVYNGLPNPNYNRLTFLYAHVYPDNPANNHYHSKGRYQLIGTPPNVSTNVNPSNFLPEGALPPLLLTVGSGIYAGKYVAAPYTDTNDQNFAFSKLEIRNTEELAAAITNSSASILFNSSAGRWTGALTGADVHLVLEYLTPGLNVGSLDATNIGLNNPEDDYHIGDGLFSFTPVLWTEAHAAPGTYVAQFRLSDESGTFLDSGTFEFRVLVAPAPAEIVFDAEDPMFVDGMPRVAVPNTSPLRTYGIEATTNLMDGPWFLFGGMVTGTSGTVWFELPDVPHAAIRYMVAPIED